EPPAPAIALPRLWRREGHGVSLRRSRPLRGWRGASGVRGAGGDRRDAGRPRGRRWRRAVTAEQAWMIEVAWGRPGPPPVEGWRCCMRCGEYWAPAAAYWCDPGKRL